MQLISGTLSGGDIHLIILRIGRKKFLARAFFRGISKQSHHTHRVVGHTINKTEWETRTRSSTLQEKSALNRKSVCFRDECNIGGRAVWKGILCQPAPQKNHNIPCHKLALVSSLFRLPAVSYPGTYYSLLHNYCFPEAVPRIEKSIKTVADCGSQRKPPESLQRQESTDGVEANGSISTRAAA